MEYFIHFGLDIQENKVQLFTNFLIYAEDQLQPLFIFCDQK
jgi:hypothetical protein